MELREFFDEIKKKKDDIKTDADLAEHLGASSVNVAQWRNKTASARILYNIFERFERAIREKTKKNQRSKLIHPIVEFLPITKVPANDKKENWLLFETKGSDRDTPFLVGLKARLVKTTSGVYVFFNSSGLPLYVGQVGRSGTAGKQTNNLWNEMTDAFNRQGLNRNIYGDPVNLDEEFRTVRDRGRKVAPRRIKSRLCDVASSFSAYEIAPGMAGTVEALLVRVAANMLFNDRMENF